MIITRKIGAILRGKATPFQLASGCILGALLGFLPGFSTAPGLTIVLALLLVLLNANLFLAAVVGGVGKLLSLVLMSVSFSIGQLLLDGPLGGLFSALINTPVFALLGVENYAATGGLVLGTIWGILAAFGVVRGVSQFRQRMADASAHSERYQKWNSKAWVRWSVFLLAGGGLKDPDYAELAQKKVGNPIRPLGLVFVGVTVTFLVVAYKFFAPSIITTALRDGLEQANGATVELGSADLDLSSGRFIVTDLAMADPNNLGTNIFAADHIEADISGADLLRKRLTIDNIIIRGASLSGTRRVKGSKVSTAPEAEDQPTLQIPDAGTLEEYWNNAQVWRERLAQAKSWLDRLSGGDTLEANSEDAGPSWQERLQRIAEERGYAAVTADHLITDAPRLLISNLLADNVTASWLSDETLSISAKNLSTQPRLVSVPVGIEITSSGGTTGLSVNAGSTTRVAAHYRGISADSVGAALQKNGSNPPLKGGTIDVTFQGTYSTADGTIDWPLEVKLNDTTVQIAGREIPLKNFNLPIALTGSLGSPTIKIDKNQFAKIAQQAGTQLLKDKASEVLGDKAGGLIKGLFGGAKDSPEDDK